MYLDDCFIKITAGNGGNGSNSFRREKYIPKGGPDGGNGGCGGSVFFVGDKNLNSLGFFKMHTLFKAENGFNGSGANKFGKNGNDLFIYLPLGTTIYENDKVFAEILEDKEKVLAASGGRGGRGNFAFKSSKFKAPLIYEKGEPGEIKAFRLSLTHLANAGLIGFPSAGKTSFLNFTTGTKKETAQYEFTTLTPQLGEVIFPDGERFTLADLPGIIKDAHLGKGLGHKFLKHLERVEVLIFFISVENNPLKTYEDIINEITYFNKDLLLKEQVIVLSKSDLGYQSESDAFLKVHKDAFLISVNEETGIDVLLKAILEKVKNAKKQSLIKPKTKKVVYTLEEEPPFFITKNTKNEFFVKGKKLEKIFQMTDFNVYDNEVRFAQIIKKMGVEDELIKMGATKDSVIYICDLLFKLED